jgi:hypothetical protein
MDLLGRSIHPTFTSGTGVYHQEPFYTNPQASLQLRAVGWQGQIYDNSSGNSRFFSASAIPQDQCGNQKENKQDEIVVGIIDQFAQPSP